MSYPTATAEKLYSLKLFEWYQFDIDGIGTELVLRVPGGWLFHDPSNEQSRAFVPYSDEFNLDGQSNA